MFEMIVLLMFVNLEISESVAEVLPTLIKIPLSSSSVCEEVAERNDILTVHYIGMLLSSNEEFENSYVKNNTFSFTLGIGDVIKGWDRGLIGMCVGEKRRLLIPSSLAFGKEGEFFIGPNANVKYDIELVSLLKFEEIKRRENEKRKSEIACLEKERQKKNRVDMISKFWNGNVPKEFNGEKDEPFKRHIPQVIVSLEPRKEVAGEGVGADSTYGPICCDNDNRLNAVKVSGVWRSLSTGKILRTWTDLYLVRHLRVNRANGYNTFVLRHHMNDDTKTKAVQWADAMAGVCIGEHRRMLVPAALIGDGDGDGDGDGRAEDEGDVEVRRSAEADGGVIFDFEVNGCGELYETSTFW